MDSSEVRPLSSIEDLPLDVIEIITYNLTWKDLAACCAVSHRMREVFGDDILWRRHCDVDVAEYLRTTACKVEPVFVSPETGDNSNMSPISYWRMAFMRENHLWNNWRQGKFKKEFLIGKSHHKLLPLIVGFLTNDFVMVVTKTKINVLDVRYYPAAKAVEQIDLNFAYPEHLQIHGQNDVIVILCLSCVRVYHLEFCTQQSILKYMFFFEDSEKLLESEYEKLNTKLNTMGNHLYVIKMLHLVEGKYFVGIFPEELVMHVWDLEKGVKLKAESLPIDTGSVKAIKGYGTGVVGIAIEDFDYSKTTYLAYSLANLCFLPLKKTGTKYQEFYVTNNSIRVCCVPDIPVTWHSFQNLEQFRNQLCCCPTPNHRVQTFGHEFLLIQNSCLIVINPARERLKRRLLSGTKWFQVLSKRIIQVQRRSGFGVWEITDDTFRKTMAATFGCGTISSANKASSRCIVILDRVGAVLHYW